MGDGPLMENYNPADRLGDELARFSWSAAMLLELDHQS